MPTKFSKPAFIIAALYVLAAAAVFIMHLYSVKTNAGDSGESAIPFFLLTLPWMLWLAKAWAGSALWPWLAYPLAWFCVLLNAVMIYGGVAGVRWIAGQWFIFVTTGKR